MIPIKSWVTDIEPEALEQAKNLADMPFAFHHVALMPDCHLGYGMPIGGVLATMGVVIPNAVGVDIGCGMHFIHTNIKIPTNINEIVQKIKAVIPVGFNKHTTFKHEEEYKKLHDNTTFIQDFYENNIKSLGTLGGGNHFIELQKDENDNLCVMIHSGSRNLGKQVCNHYNKKAEELHKQWYSNYSKDLAFLPTNSDIGKDYLLDMNFCIEYAKLNRELMMQEVKNILNCAVIESPTIVKEYDVLHNYARLENHYGKNVMVHRKGATSAKLDELGIIPGSQGTASYIVRGLGNQDSFMSCSHGAGRKMGRRAAQRNLDLTTEKDRLDKLGIVHSIQTIKDLDEAPGAYKDIDQVMQNQSDLVKIVCKLTPIAVVKG